MPSPREPWRIHFLQRHRDDDPDRQVPALVFLDAIPAAVAATMQAVLEAVAAAPPPAFSGGGMWKAMHDDMAGFYEVRVMGPGKRLYRLFCVLERDAPGLGGPSVVAITGLSKANERAFTRKDYTGVRALGAEYRGRSPRSVLT
jgi:hypothetical protein